MFVFPLEPESIFSSLMYPNRAVVKLDYPRISEFLLFGFRMQNWEELLLSHSFKRTNNISKEDSVDRTYTFIFGMRPIISEYNKESREKENNVGRIF